MTNPSSSPFESAIDSCKAIAALFRTQEDPRKVDQLRADYVHKSAGLRVSERAPLDRQLIYSLYPKATDRDLEGEMAGKRRHFDVAVVSVQPVEWSALRHVFDVDTTQFDLGPQHQRYFFGEVESVREKRTLSVVLTNIGRDKNVDATMAVRDLLSRFECDALFLVGMAAGREAKYQLGDVVVPMQVHYYEGGTLTPEGLIPRVGRLSIAESLQNDIGYFDHVGSGFYDRLRSSLESADPSQLPSSGFDPLRRIKVDKKQSIIASGEKVIRDELLERLAGGDELITCGDEESWGFAKASRDIRFGIFRGISDFGTLSKNSEWQFAATVAAAELLKLFLRDSFIPAVRA